MKKSKSFYLLWIAIIASILGMLFMFFGPSTNIKEKVEVAQPVQLLEFNGADLHEKKDGKIVWIVKAEKILFNPKTKDVYLTNAKAEFNDQGTKLIVDMDKASITNNQTLIIMKGHVDAKTADGVKFIGDNLVFNAKKQTMKTDKSFKYINGKTVITGDSLTGDMVLKHIKVLGNAKIVEE